MKDAGKSRDIVVSTVRVGNTVVAEINSRGSHDTFTCDTVDGMRTLIADLQSALGQMQESYREEVKRVLSVFTADELETLAKEKRAREAKTRRGR